MFNCFFKRRKGIFTDFGVRYAETSQTNVVSRPCIPPASAGTMSTDVGELSLDLQTWAVSITYTPGAKVWARADASVDPDTSVVCTVTGVGWSGSYTVTTYPELLAGLIDESGAFFNDENQATLVG